MKKHCLIVTILVSLVISLSACLGPTTPQEVTAAFWRAVIESDARTAVRYSTLTESKYYDGFSKDWDGYQPSFGRVIIEKDKATVASEFAAPANSGRDDRHCITYLVRRDGEWKVNYDRTGQSVRGGALGGLLDAINEFGDGMSRQLGESADRFKHEMDRMSEELEQLSDSFSEQASKSMEKYAEQLRKSIKQLEEAINRALEKENNNLSDQEKRSLRSIADDLEQDRKNLSEPNVRAVSASSRNIGEAQQQLDAIDNDSLDDYRNEWRVLTAQLEADMKKMLDDLASASDGEGSD